MMMIDPIRIFFGTTIIVLLLVAVDIASSFTPLLSTHNDSRLFPTPRLLTTTTTTTGSTNGHKYSVLLLQQPPPSLLLRPYCSSSSSSSSSSNFYSSINSNIDESNNDSTSNNGITILTKIDQSMVRTLIKLANHIPALASIGYFGLISMAGMMPHQQTQTMASNNKNNKAAMATLASVLTQNVGTTTNAEFAKYFSTLITPPSWIFLIWPVISVVQLVTVLYSAIQSTRSIEENNDREADKTTTTTTATTNNKTILSQDDLTALSLSNIMSSFWLVASSTATQHCLPIGSVLVLPFVPLLSGYSLRQRQRTQQQRPKKEKETMTKKATTTTRTGALMFQVYSSFTTVAALLQVTIELQYGGRFFPSLFGNQPELCAMVFLVALGRSVVVSSKSGGMVQPLIQTTVLWGILSKRCIDTFAKTGIITASSAAATAAAATTGIPVKRYISTMASLVSSISLITTTIVTIIATKKLFNNVFVSNNNNSE